MDHDNQDPELPDQVADRRTVKRVTIAQLRARKLALDEKVEAENKKNLVDAAHSSNGESRATSRATSPGVETVDLQEFSHAANAEPALLSPVVLYLQRLVRKRVLLNFDSEGRIIRLDKQVDIGTNVRSKNAQVYTEKQIMRHLKDHLPCFPIHNVESPIIRAFAARNRTQGRWTKASVQEAAS